MSLRRPKLGKTQAAILKCLVEHGGKWGTNAFAGWVWSTHNATRKIFETLAAKGVVDRTPNPKDSIRATYSINDLGRACLEDLKFFK
jgi:DNA-binding MarR family transcriptional regulator